MNRHLTSASVASGSGSDPSLIPGRAKRLQLSLRMPAQWDQIERIRQAVALCLAVTYGAEELIEQMTMASAELLENAVKHGAAEPIWFLLEGDGESLVVSVRSPLREQRECVRLTERLRWIRSFPAPRDAFLAAMESIYEQAAQGAIGGELAGGSLGLVRIAYEGACRLACDLSEPGYVTVQAARAVGPPRDAEPPERG